MGKLAEHQPMISQATKEAAGNPTKRFFRPTEVAVTNNRTVEIKKEISVPVQTK